MFLTCIIFIFYCLFDLFVFVYFNVLYLFYLFLNVLYLFYLMYFTGLMQISYIALFFVVFFCAYFILQRKASKYIIPLTR